MLAREADHLARDRLAAGVFHNHARPHRHGMNGAGHLHHEAPHPHDASVDLDRFEVADLVSQGFHDPS